MKVTPLSKIGYTSIPTFISSTQETLLITFTNNTVVLIKHNSGLDSSNKENKDKGKNKNTTNNTITIHFTPNYTINTPLIYNGYIITYSYKYLYIIPLTTINNNYITYDTKSSYCYNYYSSISSITCYKGNIIISQDNRIKVIKMCDKGGDDKHSKEEGVNSKGSKEEGVRDSTNRQQGVNNIVDKQQGVRDSTNRQQGVNNIVDKQQGVSLYTRMSYYFSNSKPTTNTNNHYNIHTTFTDSTVISLNSDSYYVIALTVNTINIYTYNSTLLLHSKINNNNYSSLTPLSINSILIGDNKGGLISYNIENKSISKYNISNTPITKVAIYNIRGDSRRDSDLDSKRGVTGKRDNNKINNTIILLHTNGMLYILSNTYTVTKTLYCDTFFLTDKGVYIIKDILNVLLLERDFIEDIGYGDTNTPSTNTPSTNTPSTNTPSTNTPSTNTPSTNTPTNNTPTTNTPTISNLYILRKYDKVFFIDNKYICYHNNKITVIINNRIIKEINVEHHIYDLLFIKGYKYKDVTNIDVNTLTPCYLIVIITSKQIIYTDYNTLINKGIVNDNDRYKNMVNDKGVISTINTTNTTDNSTNDINNNNTTDSTINPDINNSTDSAINPDINNSTDSTINPDINNNTNSDIDSVIDTNPNYIFCINNMSIVNYNYNSVILKDDKYVFKYDINKRVLVRLLEIKDNRYIKKVLLYGNNVLFLYDSVLEDKEFRIDDVLDCYVGGCYLYVIKKNELSIYTMKYNRIDSDVCKSVGEDEGVSDTYDDNTPLNNNTDDNTPLSNNTSDNTPLNHNTDDNTPLNNNTSDNTPLSNNDGDNTPLSNNTTNPVNTPNDLIYTLICSLEINILKTVCYDTIIYFITLNNTVKVDKSIYHMNVKCSDIYFYEYEGVIYVGIKNDCQFSFFSEEDINKCFKKGLGNEDMVDDDTINDISDSVVIDNKNKINSFFSVEEIEFRERNEDLMNLCENVERLETTANRYGKEASDLKERMKKKFWFF